MPSFFLSKKKKAAGTHWRAKVKAGTHWRAKVKAGTHWRANMKAVVGKTKPMFNTRKILGSNLKLKRYNQKLKQFKFLKLWLDERITWAVHIQKGN